MARAAGMMLLAVLVLLTANVSAWSIPLGQSSRDGRIESFESEPDVTAPEIEQLLDEITVEKNLEEDARITTIITPILGENKKLHLKTLPSLEQRLFEGFTGSKNFRKSGSLKKSKLIKPRLHHQNAFDESDDQEIRISMKPPQCSTAGLCRTTKKKCETVTCSTKQPCEPTAAPVTPDLCGTTEAPDEENCGTTEAPEKENCEITKNPCEKTREPCESTKSFCATKKAPKSVPRKFPGSKNFRKSGSFKKSKLIRPRLHQQKAFDESDNQEISLSMKPPQCSTAGLCRTTKKKCETVTCSTKQPCEPTAAPVTPDLCGTTEAPDEENCGTTEAPEKENCVITKNPCEKTREPCESTKSFCATKKAPKSVSRKFPGSKNFRKSGSLKKSKLIKPRLHHQNAFDESDDQEIRISMKPPQCSTAGLCRTTKKKCETVTCSTKQPCEPTAAPVTPDLCGTTEAPDEENCGTTEAPEKENCEITKNPCEKTREPCESTKSFCATKKAPKSVPRKFPGSKNFRKSGSFEKSKLIRPRLHQQKAFDESDNQEISLSMKPPQCSTAGLCRTTKKKCETVTCSTKQPCEPTAAPVTPDLCGTTEAPDEENCGTTEAPEKENCEITKNPCEKTREPCESTKSFCATKKAPKSVPRKFPGSKNFRKSGSFKKSKLIRPRLHQQKAFDESDNQEISLSMKPPQCSTAGLCRTTKKKCETVTCSTKQPCEPTAAPVTPDLCGTTEAPDEENCGTTEAPEKENCEITKNPCEKTREPCESTKSFCATKKAPKSVPRKFPGSKNFRKSGSFKKSKLIRPRLHQQKAFDESDNQEISLSMKPPQCSTAGLCRTTKKKCETVTCSTKQPCEPTAAPVTPDLCGTTEAPDEENCGTTEAPEKENCEITKNPCEKTREPCESTKSFCATKKAPKSVPRKFPGSKNFRKSGSFKKSKLIRPRLHQQKAFDESDNQEISLSMKPPQCSTAGLCRTTKKKCETVTCSTKQPCEPTAAPVTPDLCGTTEAPDEENCGTTEAPEKENCEITENPCEENCGTTEAPEKENCEITENPCEKTREPCESTKSFCATKKAPKSVPRKFPGSKNFRKSGSFKKSKLIRPRLHQQKAFDESDNQEISISMKPPQCSTAGLCRTTKKKCETVTCSTKQPCEPTAAPVTPDLCGTTEAPDEENCGTTEAPEKENCEITKNPCEKTREPCESTKSFCATKKAPKSVPRKFPGSKNFRKSGSFKKSKLIRPRLHQQKAFDESDNQEISLSMKPPQCSTAGLCRTTKKKCETVTCSTKQPCEPTAAPVTPDLCGTTEAPDEENCGTTEAPEKENCEITENPCEENCGTTEAPEKENCEITENPCEKTREPCESTKSFCATKKAPKSVPRKFPGSKNFRKSGSFKKSKLIRPRLHQQKAFDESDNQEISISMKPPQCSTAGLCRTTKKKCETVTCSTKQPCEPTAAPVTPDLCGTTEAPEEENCGTTEAPEKESCETT